HRGNRRQEDAEDATVPPRPRALRQHGAGNSTEKAGDVEEPEARKASGNEEGEPSELEEHRMRFYLSRCATSFENFDLHRSRRSGAFIQAQYEAAESTRQSPERTAASARGRAFRSRTRSTCASPRRGPRPAPLAASSPGHPSRKRTAV